MTIYNAFSLYGKQMHYVISFFTLESSYYQKVHLLIAFLLLTAFYSYSK